VVVVHEVVVGGVLRRVPSVLPEDFLHVLRATPTPHRRVDGGDVVEDERLHRPTDRPVPTHRIQGIGRGEEREKNEIQE